jgi:hypothetical protein
MSYTVPTPPILGDSAANTPYVMGIALSRALGSHFLGFDVAGATSTQCRLGLLHVANHHISSGKKQWT